MVASLPITCAATIVTDSQITGFTLPGMIDEPGWTSGIAISAIPARGPHPSSRMSPAILYIATAMARSAPLAATTASSVDCALKWLSVSRSGMPRSAASSAITCAGNSGWVPTPVPTAVPPSGSSASARDRLLAAAPRSLHLARVAEELLTEPDRRRVLQVGAAGLDHRPQLVGLAPQRRLQDSQAGDGVLADQTAAATWIAVGITSLLD